MSLADFQQALKARGWDPGPADGDWGPRTELAAMAAISTAVPPPEPEIEIDPRAIALIKHFESFRAQAYRDGGGVWTIGYGTTARAGVGINPVAGMVISEPEAEMYLCRAVEKFAGMIRPAITRRITATEFGAFVSLTYNIGPAAFLRSSALRHFNAGDKPAAGLAMLAWRYAHGRVLPGLVRRRAAERDLFLSEGG